MLKEAAVANICDVEFVIEFVDMDEADPELLDDDVYGAAYVLAYELKTEDTIGVEFIIVDVVGLEKDEFDELTDDSDVQDEEDDDENGD
jgi:hypothetical protein